MKTITTNGDDGRHTELLDKQQRARLGHYFRRHLGDTPEADECVRETLSRLAAFVKNLRGGQTEFTAVFSMRIAYLLCVERETERRSVGRDRQAGRYGVGRLESQAVTL